MNPKLIGLLDELDISDDLRRRFKMLYARFSSDEAGRGDTVSGNGDRLGKYTDMGLLGRGGMAEVRRVHDPDLSRRLAMKIIDDKLMVQGSALTRFVNEAQTLSQLQHPNIIPVHEMGQLEDGRYFFTMKEVKGQPLSHIISKVHEASSETEWRTSSDGWGIYRLLSVFSKICAAVSFAHSRGVIHRDLKPENILIGKFDQVLVVDWGIAKILGSRGPDSNSDEAVVVTESDAYKTQMGSVAGTPAYMAPEQARGLIDQIDERTDIYTLGSILYEILSGRTPYGGATRYQVLGQVIAGPPTSVRATVLHTHRLTETIELDFFEDEDDDFIEEAPAVSSSRPLPDELVIACEKAMQRTQAHRFQTVDALNDVIQSWLDGVKKTEEALGMIDLALNDDAKRRELIAKATELSSKAAVMSKGLPPWTPESDMSPIWSLEDEAAGLLNEAGLLRVRIEQQLHGSLTLKADLPEAHERLIDFYLTLHKEAEALDDEIEMASAKCKMEFHIEQLHADNPVRRKVMDYLAGIGSLSLTTSPTGAEVWLAEYQLIDRRLILGKERLIGHTPIVDMPLGMGSYRLRLHKDGFEDVNYPIYIARQGRWDNIDPDGVQQPIALPISGSLGPEDCYVPAGWFLCGGDPNVQLKLPTGRIWVDGFVTRRFSITNREILEQLNDLAERGLQEQLEAAIPRPRSASGEFGHSCFVKDSDGRFVMGPDESGVTPALDFPVTLVNWRQAVAYTHWHAEKTGQPWRLLHEMEWEKAGRGVDGRFFPWGRFFNPSWCNMDSSKETKGLESVDLRPEDESVYGVRGMSGNVFELLINRYDPLYELPSDKRCRPVEPDIAKGDPICFRGGSWHSMQMFSHLAFRFGWEDFQIYSMQGFRIGRSLGELKVNEDNG